MSIVKAIHSFARDLRSEGLPLSPDELVQCFRALQLVEWDVEDVFYSALYTTLVKDHAYHEIFEKVYARHFQGDLYADPKNLAPRVEEYREELRSIGDAGGSGAGGEGSGDDDRDDGGGERRSGERLENHKDKKPRSRPRPAPRDLLDKNFLMLTTEELKFLEELLPVIAKRLASRMIKKRKKQLHGSLDYRRTFRHSLSTGGVPAELFVRHKVKEKPVIFALCDVSTSVWEFSYFSLALVHSLERFFRRVRSFAFVDRLDEITDLLRNSQARSLRGTVLSQARVISEGRTNYGASLKEFWERYGRELSPQAQVLIFGDGRNNWYSSEEEYLAKIAARARRVYWFNPEERKVWNSGDSIMFKYQEYCYKVFPCPSLLQLEQAISSL